MEAENRKFVRGDEVAYGDHNHVVFDSVNGICLIGSKTHAGIALAVPDNLLELVRPCPHAMRSRSFDNARMD